IYRYPRQPSPERLFKTIAIIITVKCSYLIKCPDETFVCQFLGIILVLYIPHRHGAHITVAVFIYEFFTSFISVLGTAPHRVFQRQHMLPLQVSDIETHYAATLLLISSLNSHYKLR